MLTGNFIYQSPPLRVRFGAGALGQLGDEIGAIGGTRALILSTPFQKPDAEALAERIGPLAAGVFAEARMHTPVEVTALALQAFADCGADCIVSYGGGSTIGLGKGSKRRLSAGRASLLACPPACPPTCPRTRWLSCWSVSRAPGRVVVDAGSVVSSPCVLPSRPGAHRG